MQTVSSLVRAGAAGAPDMPVSTGIEGGEFPAAVRQAMQPWSGKPLPPAGGDALPPPAEVDTALLPIAPVSPDGEGGDAPARFTPLPELPHADGRAGLPQVADALRDISAGRAAAPPAKAAATQSALAEFVETAQSERPAPAGDRPAKAAARRAADAPAVPPPDMAVVCDPVLLPAATPLANPPPRAVAAEATSKAREKVALSPAAEQAHGLMAMEQPAALPDSSGRPALPSQAVAGGARPMAGARPASAAGEGTVSTAQAVTVEAGPTERVPVADLPPLSTGTDAGLLAAPALAPAGVGVPAPAGGATVQVPEFSLAATPGSTQFGTELRERVLWLVREGMHEARLQLNPRELGPVEVRLSVGDGAAQVSFSAQHAGTAAAVQQSLPQLRELLAQQGLQLGQASVFHQPTGDGDAARQQQAASGQPGWHGAGGQGSEELDAALPAAPARLLGRGLVDAYA